MHDVTPLVKGNHAISILILSPLNITLKTFMTNKKMWTRHNYIFMKRQQIHVRLILK